MKVRFDSLNRFEMPKLTLCNPGSVYRDGITTKAIGILTDTSDEEAVFNFNAKSEFNLRVTRVSRGDPQIDAHTKKLYDALQNHRLVFADNIGYFVICNVQDGYANGLDYKDIKMESCEREIEKKNLTYIQDGTYRFIDLLETIVSTLPRWTIGSVDSAIREKYRTFQDVDPEMNTLSFFLTDMQEAYECIFQFDIINRRIHVYDQNNYVVRTDIHLTKEDVIQELHIDENADDLYTAVRVSGDEDLNIAPLNPLGTSVIYNFDHYLDWMTDDLRDKVSAWSERVDTVSEAYYDLNVNYYEKLTENSNLQSELEKQEIVLGMYKRCRENIVAESSTDRVSSYNDIISANGGAEISIDQEISATLSEIDSLIQAVNGEILSTTDRIMSAASELEALYASIEAIHKSVAITEYFTPEEYDELYDYIFEGNYQDEYITVTDSMTYAEKFRQMKTLYDRAVSQLKKVSAPTQEFSLNVENFLFAKRFLQWSEQLETGCLINVELKPDDVAALFLSTIVVNYADKSLSMTFGNRYNKFDPKSLFDDVLGGIKKSSNSIDFIKDTIYPIKNGAFNAVQEALANSRNLTKNAALASRDEEVLIDDTGYTGKRKLSDGQYDPRQVKITGRTIVFTDDAWQTCKVAIGEIVFDNETSTYGINAQAIIGDLIIGNGIRILNNDGTELFTAIDNRITANIAKEEWVSPDNFGEVLRRFNATIEADGEALRQYYKFHSELDAIVTDISAYIHSGHILDDAQGNPIYGVKIGRADSNGNFYSAFTAEEIAFYDSGNDKVAFLSNKKLNVETVRTTKIELSDDLDDSESNNWQISMDNGFCIRWIGK